MAKCVGKGRAKDNSYIYLKFLCNNGVDTYNEIFYIDDFIFTGYGCYERTPDFEIKVFGTTYECFWRSKTTGCDNKCRVKKGE